MQVFDLQSEERPFGGQTAPNGLRSSLEKVLPSLLRLAAVTLYTLPPGQQLRDSAAAFIEAHHKAFLQILRDAGETTG